jgi:DNA-binding beta-propeller fold protein YncE
MKRAFRLIIPSAFAIALLLFTNGRETAQQRQTDGPAPGASGATRQTTRLQRAPTRTVKDAYTGFSSVAVDVTRNEIILQDENNSQIAVYGRMDNTPPQAALTEPKRIIGGSNTNIAMNCAVYVDPDTGDIYSVNGDIEHWLTVWSREKKGNVAPDRQLITPHRTYGIAVDEQTNEMFIATQHPASVLVWRKTAQNKDAPVRILEGEKTRLAEAQGVAVDSKNQLLYVGNKGAFARNNNNVAWARTWQPGATTWDVTDRVLDFVPGSGEFRAPSINVYALKASGDTPPLRVIQGPQTRLDWPGHISLDVENQELYVTGPVTDEILVFRATDSGNVAPIRVLKGPKTGLSHPNGVFVDNKNDEVVVANFGNHSSTVYRRTASGDTAPIRTIRAAPAGTPAPTFGRIGAMTYDTKRDEFLIFN